MRLQLISLDLMVALPIACAAVILLFGGFYSAQSYLVGSEKAQQTMLSLYYDSQVAVSIIGTGRQGYNASLSLLDNLSFEYGVNESLGKIQGCAPLEVCRVVTVSGKSYELMVRE